MSVPYLNASISTFPGAPLTLDQLWSSSTFVGLVSVTSVEQIDNVTRVGLSITKSLKNSVDSDKNLSVDILRGGCPYPFDFREGQQVLVFLKYNIERGIFSPVGATESAVELTEETFELYSKRLLELPPILSISDETEMYSELLKWYIKCAESPQMRYDGAWGISSLRQRKLAELTRSQSLQIVNILIPENPPKLNSASLFAQISSFPNEKIDLYLLEALHRSHETGWSELTRSAIEHLPDRLGVKLPKSTAKRLDEYWKLLSKVNYGFIDDQPENDELPTRDRAEEIADANERLAILWGSISNEIYFLCKTAIEHPSR